MQKRISDISPNIHTEKLFPDSLTDESIEPLAADIEANGLREPIRITKAGAVIIDGERRWRACKKLRWTHIEVIEEDIHRKKIFERVVASAATNRHMTLFDQARLYKAYYLYLTRANNSRAAGNMGRTHAKHLAVRVAQFPFQSIKLADRIIYIMENGGAAPDLHERVLRGETSIEGTYERVWRRYGRQDVEDALPRPEPSPHQELRNQVRAEERRAREQELDFARQYIDAHQHKLAAEEAQRRLLQLFEPEPPPAARKYRGSEATEVIAEAFEALAVKEPPEQLAGRLTNFVENIIGSVREVDEQRARDIIREAVKPMVLRLAYQYPRQEYDLPVEDGTNGDADDNDLDDDDEPEASDAPA